MLDSLKNIERWERFANRWLPDDRSTKSEGLDVPENFADFANLCRIRSGKRIIPFHLYDYQQELSRIIDNHRGVIVVKTRQMGITETIACKLLHRACLNRAYAAVVLSMGQEESFNVSDRIKMMPQFAGFDWATASKKQLVVEGGGKLFFRPSTDNAGRSLESISDLLFDEVGFIPNIEELYSSATPSQEMVGDAAKTMLVSTLPPEGKLSWFWQMFDAGNGAIDAERIMAQVREGYGDGFHCWTDESGWAKVVIHWKAHPIYCEIPDYLDRTRKSKKLSEDKLQREYNLGLPASGGMLFGATDIDRSAVGDWQPPHPMRYYLAGVDPNFGGTDYFTFLVWDITTRPYSLVAQYRNHDRAVMVHLAEVSKLLQQYNPVLTAVESNSGGAIVLEALIAAHPEMRFESVLTTGRSKIVNTDRLAVALEAQDVIYPPDWEGIAEMHRFLLSDRQATIGHHDDCIMAWAAAWAWLDEAIENKPQKIEFLRLGKRSSFSN